MTLYGVIYDIACVVYTCFGGHLQIDTAGAWYSVVLSVTNDLSLLIAFSSDQLSSRSRYKVISFGWSKIVSAKYPLSVFLSSLLNIDNVRFGNIIL